jgi:hypothetical protein
MTRAFADPVRSPYAVVGRYDFSGGTPLIFGSANDCSVQLDGLAPHQLSAHVEGEAFVLQSVDWNTSFVILAERGEGAERREARIPPGGRVRLGRYLLRFSHQNFPAVLVSDPQSQRLAAHAPPIWFDADPSFRVEARLRRDPTLREEVVLSTRGQRRRALRLGTLLFSLQGAAHELTALRLLEPGADEAGISIFFRDATSGNESYPVGRYLEPQPLDAAGDRWLLDFNRAYNPSCAFSTHFNCPIPPRENLLSIAVRAGERDPHAIEHEAP